MKKYIIVTADINDGDYISEKSVIEDKILEELKPVIFILNKSRYKYSHNWEKGECRHNSTPEALYLNTGLLTQEQIDLFDNYVPSGEFGIHTIKSIEILEVSKEERLL